MENQTSQPKRKSRKWLWISGGIILFIILISIISGSEEKKEVGPAQVSQPQTSQEQQIQKEKSKTTESSNSDKIKVKTFMCANFCAMPQAIISIKNWNPLKDCMNECLSLNSPIDNIVKQMSIDEIKGRSKDFLPELFEKITKEIQKN